MTAASPAAAKYGCLLVADVAVQLGHTDGGRLMQTLYGHPDEDRARDRLRMAFAGDGRTDPVIEPPVGHISDAHA